jgi:alkylation response protein AidB-like acyl-CoA dehydrogenase
MDLRYSPEDERFREEVHDWLDHHLRGDFAGVRDKGGPGREHEAVEQRLAWERVLGRAGYIGMAWPADVGGRDLSLTQQMIFWEEYVRAGGPGRLGVVGDWLLAPTLIAHGTREQQRRFLPRILAGEELWCQGYSEPDAGSDLAGLSTRAVLDGDEWVVTGHKVWTSLAHLAQWSFVLCRTGAPGSRHRGISYLLVPMDQPGVHVRPLTDITGGATDFSEMTFDGARTARENLVGEVDGGWQVAMSTAYLERGASTVGYQLSFGQQLARIVERARVNGRDRHPVVRQHLAQASIEFRLLQWNVLRTLSAVRAGNHSPVTNIYKLFWSAFHQRLGELAMEVMGPAGQLTAPPPHRFDGLQTVFLYSRGETIYGGSHQIQQNIVAERALGLPPEPKARQP